MTRRKVCAAKQWHHALYALSGQHSAHRMLSVSLPQSFRASAWYHQGPAEAPAIKLQLWSKSHTHTGGMKAFRSVSTTRVCSWTKKGHMYPRQVVQERLGWNTKGTAERWTKLNWPDTKWEKLNGKMGEELLQWNRTPTEGNETNQRGWYETVRKRIEQSAIRTYWLCLNFHINMLFSGLK